MNNTATTYPKSSKRTATRQPAKAKKRTSQARKKKPARQAGDKSNTMSLPGWKEIHAKEKKRKNRVRSKKRATIEQISTPKFALYTFVAVLLMSLYVSHVFATQKALTRLEDAQRQHLQLTLEYNQKKATFDNLVSPDEVYRRAKELGLSEGTTFGPPLLWKPESTD